MKKNRFDTRSFTEIVNMLVLEHLSPGDKCEMHVQYNKSGKPNVTLVFHGRKGRVQEEVTDFLPDKPHSLPKDSITGQPLKYEPSVGFATWQDAIGARTGYSGWVKTICNSKNVYFDLVVKE